MGGSQLGREEGFPPESWRQQGQGSSTEAHLACDVTKKALLASSGREEEEEATPFLSYGGGEGCGHKVWEMMWRDSPAR